MTSEDFVMEICSFFARNPDEELTVEDAATKWDLDEMTVRNWSRRLTGSKYVQWHGNKQGKGMFKAGPALK